MKSRWKLKNRSVNDKNIKLQSAKSWNQSPPSVLSGWKSHRIWWVKRNFQTRISHLSVNPHLPPLIHPKNHRRHSSHPPSYLIAERWKKINVWNFHVHFHPWKTLLLHLHDDHVGSPQVRCRRLKPVEPDHWHKESTNKECNFSRSWDYVSARGADDFSGLPAMRGKPQRETIWKSLTRTNAKMKNPRMTQLSRALKVSSLSRESAERKMRGNFCEKISDLCVVKYFPLSGLEVKKL